MDLNDRNSLANPHRATTPATRFGWSRSILAVLAVFALAASTAHASCGRMLALKPMAALNLPSPALLGPADIADNDFPGASSNIVGLWHVVYTASDGSFFYDALDLWHSDGTEFENANLPPAIGNICFGAWKQVGPHIHLHHVGWNFDTDGTSLGTFTLDEVNTVAPNGNTYTGSFTYRVYNPDGSYAGIEVTGTITATRITVS